MTVWFNYLVVAEWRWGQTLGKRAVGHQRRRRPGQGLRGLEPLVRATCCSVVDVVAGLFLIPLSRRKQRLGDRLAIPSSSCKATAASVTEALRTVLPPESVTPRRPAAGRRRPPGAAAQAAPGESVGDLGAGAGRRSASWRCWC